MSDSANFEISFAAVGDIFLGDQPVCLGFGVRSVASRYGYATLFEGVREQLSQYPLVIGNLETVIADRATVRSRGSQALVDRADPAAARAMRDAGVGLVGLANNHIFEFGARGLSETARHLGAGGVAWTGMKNFRVEELGGRKVAFLAWSLIPDTYWPELSPADFYNHAHDAADILSEVERVRHAVDFVVLMLHWGNEFVQHPSSKQREVAHALIEAGVDVLIGHHPHVLQPIERYKNGVIAYSLGNFVIDSWDDASRSGAILEVALGDRIEYRTVPICIERNTYRPLIAGRCEPAHDALGSLHPSAGSDDSAYLRSVLDARAKHRRSSLWHFAKNIHRVGIRNLAWVLIWGVRRLVFLCRIARLEKKDPSVVYRGPMH